MPSNKSENRDYDSIGSPKKGDGGEERDIPMLKPTQKRAVDSGGLEHRPQDKALVNYTKDQERKIVEHTADIEKTPVLSEEFTLKAKTPETESKEPAGDESPQNTPPAATFEEQTWAEELKKKKKATRAKKDFDILKNEAWVIRNGHFLTYAGLYLFSILVFFRPYELVPALGFLSATAFYVALATLLIYLPTQLATEGNFTTFSTEVKCVAFITIVTLVMLPLSKSPALAWETFNDTYSKAVVMFVVMVNVLRTRKRLIGIIWLALAIGFLLSYMAIAMYIRGEITVEGYRVAVDVGGMFGNPNEMALHLVMMLPIAVCLGLAEKNHAIKAFYFVTTGLFLAATAVTYSRGGFLALLACTGVLIWKLGKRQRARILAVAGFVAVLFILFAPGDYAQRIVSIFDSSLDTVGSSDQRFELLKRSIIVSIRNPWGIGIGNFPIVGVQNLGTHNAFTQVSSELGVVSLAAYLVFLVSPFRKLGAIERQLLAKNETRWSYYLAVGLQASIVAFMVAGFFAAVAYNWFAYYLIAYAVAFRRIYIIENDLNEEDIKTYSLRQDLLGWGKDEA